MLDDNLRTQLQSYLGRMTRPIVLIATLDDTDASRELQALLEDVASLSTLITLEKREADGSVRSPSFSVGRPGEDHGIRFAGIPMGHEFTSLVLALLHTGGHPPKADASVLEQIAALDGDFEFEAYISLSCQNCPEVVQALNLMAVLNPRIRSTMIDGALFQPEVAAREIMAVPSVYLNGQPFAQGRMTVEEILAKLDTTSEARRAAQLQGQGALRRADRRRRARRGLGCDLRRAQGHPHRSGHRALRRPGARHDGHRELHLRQGDRGPEARGCAREPCKDLRRGRHEPAACDGAAAGGRERACGRATREWGHAPQPQRHPVHRCAVAGNERAGRARVPREGRRVLPALRRAALQGQARRRDRWRQLRRRGCDRSRRHRRPRDADRVRRRTACGRGPATQAPEHAERARHRLGPDDRGSRRRRQGRRRSATGTVCRANCTGSSSRACSCRSVCCPTPSGSRARSA